MRALLLACLALGLAALAAADWEKPDWCPKDCPRFEQVAQEDDYETRRYEEAYWVYTRVKDLPHEEAVMKGYAELFNYFKGDNKDGKEVEMGVPVAHNVTVRHRRRSLCNEVRAWLPRWMGGMSDWERRRRERVDMTIKVYLPYDYQDGKEQPPEPNADHIHVDKFPEWTAHVRSFNGWPTKRNFMENFGELMHALEKADEDFSHRFAVFSIYNEPTELDEDKRHNEVLVGAEDDDEEGGASAMHGRARIDRPFTARY